MVSRTNTALRDRTLALIENALSDSSAFSKSSWKMVGNDKLQISVPNIVPSKPPEIVNIRVNIGVK